MSTNCIRCVTNKRTGLDLLCDDCREGSKSSTPPPANESEGVPFKLPLCLDSLFPKFIMDADGEAVPGIFLLEDDEAMRAASTLVNAVNSHAKLESELGAAYTDVQNLRVAVDTLKAKSKDTQALAGKLESENAELRGRLTELCEIIESRETTDSFTTQPARLVLKSGTPKETK